MFCPKCGTQLPDSASFCGKCGAKLAFDQTRKPSADELVSSTVAADNKWSEPAQPESHSRSQTVTNSTVDTTRSHTPKTAPSSPPRPATPTPPRPSSRPNQDPDFSAFDDKRAAVVDVAKGILPDFGPNWKERLTEGFHAAFKAPVPVQTELPLKWYKYLVWLGLYGSALYNLYILIRTTTSSGIVSIMGRAAASVFLPWYSKPLLILSFIGYAVMAAFDIYTRGRLSEFRKDAPQAMLFTYVGMFVIGLLQGLAFCVGGVGTQIGLTSILIQGIAFGVAYVLNKQYFEKRAELFIN